MSHMEDGDDGGEIQRSLDEKADALCAFTAAVKRLGLAVEDGEVLVAIVRDLANHLQRRMTSAGVWREEVYQIAAAHFATHGGGDSALWGRPH